MNGEITDIKLIRAFVCAGNARFTIESLETGTRFTYRVTKPRREGGLIGQDPPLFVSVLTGSDNTSDYEYLGVIFPDTGFRVTRRSRISDDAPSARAFRWLWKRISEDRPLEKARFWHEGRCGRCGRALTVPESIASGIGPVCEGL